MNYLLDTCLISELAKSEPNKTVLEWATVRFYEGNLGLAKLGVYAPEIVFDFGGKNLWLDKVDGLSQAETGLEVYTDDVEAADKYLKSTVPFGGWDREIAGWI